MRQKPIGVLLAGGKSSRMESILNSEIQDKSLLPLGPKLLIMHVIEKVHSQVDPLIINANLNPQRFSKFGLPVVSDTISEFSGPLAGILAGMEWSKRNVPSRTHLLSIPTDTPFIPLDLVDRLEDVLKNADETVVLARSNSRIHPVIGLWPIALSSKLDQSLKEGTRKVLDWTGSQKTLYVDFPHCQIKGKSVDPFFNINTPTEIIIAQELME